MAKRIPLMGPERAVWYKKTRYKIILRDFPFNYSIQRPPCMLHLPFHYIINFLKRFLQNLSFLSQSYLVVSANLIWFSRQEKSSPALIFFLYHISDIGKGFCHFFYFLSYMYIHIFPHKMMNQDSVECVWYNLHSSPLS